MHDEALVAFNLSGIALALKAQRRHPRLVTAIERYSGAASTLTDLRAARNAAILLIGAYGLPMTLQGELGSALLTHAVVMYCRAAASDAGRKGLDLKKLYDEDLKSRHESIRDLRNTVVAHYGIPKGEHGKRWRNERAVSYVYADQTSSFNYVVSKTNFTARSVEDLLLLTDASIPLVQLDLDKRREIMDKEFSEIPLFDSTMTSLWELHSSHYDPTIIKGFKFDNSPKVTRVLTEEDRDLIVSIFGNMLPNE